MSAARAFWLKFKGLWSVFKGCGGLSDSLSDGSPGSIHEGCALSLGPAPPFGLKFYRDVAPTMFKRKNPFSGSTAESLPHCSHYSPFPHPHSLLARPSPSPSV